MDCNCNKGKFWIGLGLGTVLGAVVCCFSRSEKAKKWKDKMNTVAQTAAEKAGEWMTNAKEQMGKVSQNETKE